jgi:hypothetical protein
MNFIFIDETGDPGKLSAEGSSTYFGMASISISKEDYNAFRMLLSQVHWLSGTATSISLRGDGSIRAQNVLRGLNELARNGLITASGLYIDKRDYGGRYIEWSDIDVAPKEWAYYLRNYLLRHLLEFHFKETTRTTEPIDLVLDRVSLNQNQQKNTFDYLNSQTDIPLRAKFGIPPVAYLTLADSEYVGGLEIAHVLADLLQQIAKENTTEKIKSLSSFMKTEHFFGHKQE